MRPGVLFLIFLVMICSLHTAQVISRAQTTKSQPRSSSAPAGWMLYPTPKEDSAALDCGNYSDREWKVALNGDNLQIRLDKLRDHQDRLPPGINSRSVQVGNKGERHVIRVGDGWLIGIDVGEFGGGLWWFSSDGKQSKKLTNDRVAGFGNSSRGVLALTGLAHMSSDYGKVLRIAEGKEGNRKTEVLADLGSAPRAFVVESPDSLIVLTGRRLARVTTAGSVKPLFQPHYQLLYPNSMTLSSSGVIYVGMRLFVTRLSPTASGYKEEWFVPKDCAKFKVRDYDCVCMPGIK